MKYRMAKMLTREEEVDLARRWRKGDRAARDQLVTSHMPYVMHVIKREFLRSDVGVDDLYQEGCIGLLRAVDKFDPERGVRFMTFAHYWIRACILTLIQRFQGAVSLHTTKAGHRIMSRVGRITALQEKGFTLEQIAERLNLNLNVMRSLEGRFGRRDASLNQMIGVNGELGDMFADDSETVEEVLAEKQAEHVVRHEIERLPRRSRQIIRDRVRGHTLAQIGRSIGLSREGVRLIERDAIAELTANVCTRGRR